MTDTRTAPPPVRPVAQEQLFGFAPEEVRLDEPTRAARLKWVVVVDGSLPPGRAANAAACVAAATSRQVTGLVADGGLDADGSPHAGLPWAGCTVLTADPATLRSVHDRARRRDDVLVVDMPLLAQETRVYAEFLARLAQVPGDEISYAAVGVVGPRRSVDRIVGGLPLLT